MNNVTIQDDLEDETMARNLSDHRSSINVYSKGAVATYDQDYSWKCKKHDQIDCEECFNWIRVIATEIEEKIQGDKRFDSDRATFDRIMVLREMIRRQALQ